MRRGRTASASQTGMSPRPSLIKIASRNCEVRISSTRQPTPAVPACRHRPSFPRHAPPAAAQEFDVFVSQAPREQFSASAAPHSFRIAVTAATTPWAPSLRNARSILDVSFSETLPAGRFESFPRSTLTLPIHAFKCCFRPAFQ